LFSISIIITIIIITFPTQHRLCKSRRYRSSQYYWWWLWAVNNMEYHCEFL